MSGATWHFENTPRFSRNKGTYQKKKNERIEDHSGSLRKEDEMSYQRANRLYLFHQYVNIDPNVAPPDLNGQWQVPSVSLLAEKDKASFFQNKTASEIVTAMQNWFIATRNENASSFQSLTTGALNPVVVNVEAFGAVFGDAIENMNEALSNVRAAIGIITALRETQSATGLYRPIGAYITIPKSKFFEAYGQESDGYNGYIANFYEKVNAATIELLSQHVDFFVLDGYVPWRGVPDEILNQFYPTVPSRAEKIKLYLTESEPDAKTPHYRYPGRARLPGTTPYLSFPAAARGIGFWNTSDWVLHTIRFIRYQMDLVARYSRGQPVMIWTSTAFLPNGYEYNGVPAPELEQPVWDLLIEFADFERFFRELIALNPWAIVLLEGFSIEKLRIFKAYGAAETSPTSPWPPGLGPRRGGLRWGASGGLNWTHPYLEQIIQAYKPTLAGP
jgi:hypothetical protein